MKTQEDIDRQNRTDIALESVKQERDEQHLKWGTQRHDWPVWLTVLAEEVGELAQAILCFRSFDALIGPDVGQSVDPLVAASDRINVQQRRIELLNCRAEAVQVAAVAVAMIEHIDETLSPRAPSGFQDKGQDFWDERTRRWEERTGQSRP